MLHCGWHWVFVLQRAVRYMEVHTQEMAQSDFSRQSIAECALVILLELECLTAPLNQDIIVAVIVS